MTVLFIWYVTLFTERSYRERKYHIRDIWRANHLYGCSYGRFEKSPRVRHIGLTVFFSFFSNPLKLKNGILFNIFIQFIISCVDVWVDKIELFRVDYQDIIRILLSYGADRQTAMEHLTKRKSKAIQNDPSLRQLHAFNTKYPYYADVSVNRMDNNHFFSFS